MKVFTEVVARLLNGIQKTYNYCSKCQYKVVAQTEDQIQGIQLIDDDGRRPIQKAGMALFGERYQRISTKP